MIAGVMPKWHQYLNRFAGVLMCLLLGGVGLVNGLSLLRAGSVRPAKGLLFISVAWAGFAIGTQLWFQRRIVCGFDYDGHRLQFRTLGIPRMQVRPLDDIAKVEEWRGRGVPIGYRLVFRDGRKVYLMYSVANSIPLANQLRRDAKG
jgi:hypothetical protein